MKNVFIISGPSGAGEDSVIDGLSKKITTERIITTTTRKMRDGDSEGYSYYFTTKENFEKRIAEGAFVEYATEYNDQLYGVTRDELERVAHSGNIGIWKIEYQGVMTAKKLFPDIVAILLTAPIEVLEARIRRRDNPDEKLLAERMAYTREWLKHTDIYDYIIENEEGKLDQTIEQVYNIITKHNA